LIVAYGAKMSGDVDFIDRKSLVNNLRTKVNMLSSKLPVYLRKTLAPTKAVRGISPFRANQGWWCQFGVLQVVVNK
jgi:hypothetical protein